MAPGGAVIGVEDKLASNRRGELRLDREVRKEREARQVMSLVQKVVKDKVRYIYIKVYTV